MPDSNFDYKSIYIFEFLLKWRNAFRKRRAVSASKVEKRVKVGSMREVFCEALAANGFSHTNSIPKSIVIPETFSVALSTTRLASCMTSCLIQRYNITAKGSPLLWETAPK